MPRTLPVYVIDGMLESGKTTFIKDTIKADDFFKKGKTLVLACEDGEIEYDNEFLTQYNTVVRFFQDQSEFTPLALSKIVEETNPNRIVIELNGMWDINKVEFPSYFKVYQFINFINFATFPIYFANMRQLFLDVVRQADVVCFINVSDDKKEELESYSSSFKLTNSAANFMIMDTEGRLLDAFKIEMPFDVNADVIKIEDKDYGIWYIDTFDHRDTYQDKIVEMNVMVIKSDTLPKDTFVAGRLAMTCCSNDIQLYGHLCLSTLGKKLKDRSWIKLKAKVDYQFSEQYKEVECLLTPLEITPISPLADPVLDLTK